MEKVLIAASGSLPAEFVVSKIETIEPAFGDVLLFSALVVVTLLAANTFLVFRVTKNVKLACISTGLVAAEIVCIFGFAAIVQNVFRLGWAFDIYSFIGLLLFSFISVLKMHKSVKPQTFEGKLFSFVYRGVAIAGFVTLFTPWRGVGIVLLMGIVTKELLTSRILNDTKKAVG